LFRRCQVLNAVFRRRLVLSRDLWVKVDFQIVLHRAPQLLEVHFILSIMHPSQNLAYPRSLFHHPTYLYQELLHNLLHYLACHQRLLPYPPYAPQLVPSNLANHKADVTLTPATSDPTSLLQIAYSHGTHPMGFVTVTNLPAPFHPPLSTQP